VHYREHNNNIFKKNKITQPGVYRGGVAAYNIRRIISIRLKSLIKGIFSYPKEILLNFGYFRALRTKKNAMRNFSCLIIGGGPSVSTLKPSSIEKFQSDGGRVIVVNYWSDNLGYADIIPDMILFSDPMTLADEAVIASNFTSSGAAKYTKKNRRLYEYLKKNNQIDIFVPLNNIRKYKKMFSNHNVYGFVDTQIPGISKSISPIFPRGYKSLSLYKALSISCFLGFSRIYIIGMDNTHIRNIYSDSKNRVHLLEQHVGEEDFLVDFSTNRDGVAGVIDDLIQNFIHLDLFKKSICSEKILNLDPYSLTDAFSKVQVDPNDEIENCSLDLRHVGGSN